MAAKSRPTPGEIVGYAIAALVWVVTALVFRLDRGAFVENAHYTAAVLMFVCILLVVGINALGYKQETGAPPRRNPYVGVAAAMAVSSAATIVAGILAWDYWVIGIEAALISLFAIFWLIQTRELWDQGLREQDTPIRLGPLRVH